MAFDPFSIFTGSAQEDAAQKTQQYLQQQQAQNAAQAAAAQQGGLAALQSGQTGAIGAIQPAIGQARTDITASTAPALYSLYGGQAQGATALQSGQYGGLGALGAGVNAATGAYQPLSNLGSQFTSQWAPSAQMSSNALGLGGQEGYNNAVQAFQTSPGYQFALDQGLNSIVRNANAAGMGAGGNALQEAQTYGQGLANQEYERWRQAVQAREQGYAGLAGGTLNQAAGGISQAVLTGGTGAANIYTGTGGRLSDLYSGTGQAGAGIYGQSGQSLADLASKGGLAEAGIYTGTGSQAANLYGNIYGTQSGFNQAAIKPMTDAYQSEAAATAGGANNFWNLLGGGTKLVAGGGFLPSGSFTPWKV